MSTYVVHVMMIYLHPLSFFLSLSLCLTEPSEKWQVNESEQILGAQFCLIARTQQLHEGHPAVTVHIKSGHCTAFWLAHLNTMWRHPSMWSSSQLVSPGPSMMLYSQYGQCHSLLLSEPFDVVSVGHLLYVSLSFLLKIQSFRSPVRCMAFYSYLTVLMVHIGMEAMHRAGHAHWTVDSSLSAHIPTNMCISTVSGG